MPVGRTRQVGGVAKQRAVELIGGGGEESHSHGELGIEQSPHQCFPRHTEG
jgi:hypothetical protein